MHDPRLVKSEYGIYDLLGDIDFVEILERVIQIMDVLLERMAVFLHVHLTQVLQASCVAIIPDQILLVLYTVYYL